MPHKSFVPDLDMFLQKILQNLLFRHSRKNFQQVLSCPKHRWEFLELGSRKMKIITKIGQNLFDKKNFI